MWSNEFKTERCQQESTSLKPLYSVIQISENSSWKHHIIVHEINNLRLQITEALHIKEKKKKKKKEKRKNKTKQKTNKQTKKLELIELSLKIVTIFWNALAFF